MLFNGKSHIRRLAFAGCSCHNTKNARRKAKKSVKAKAKASLKVELGRYR
jgi:hypothetical protein